MEYLRQSITPHLYHLITLEMWFGMGLFCNGNNGQKAGGKKAEGTE